VGAAAMLRLAVMVLFALSTLLGWLDVFVTARPSGTSTAQVARTSSLDNVFPPPSLVKADPELRGMNVVLRSQAGTAGSDAYR